MPTVGSLFAGIGGFDLGFEWAGCDVRWQVEQNPFCQAVLAKHWPTVARYDDVRTVGAHTLEPVDIIIGGFPCQDVSDAGNRVGIDDGERSGLWREFARVVRELRPRLVVVENVAGLLVRGMGRVLGDLAAIGYDAEWCCLRAADVGAPHRRLRVFVMAYPGHDQSQKFARVDGQHEQWPAVGRRSVQSAGVGTSGRIGGWDHSARIGIADGITASDARHVADAECPERGAATERRDVDYGHDAGREETPSRAAQCRGYVADADGIGRGRGGQSEFTWLESASRAEPDGCGDGRTGAAVADTDLARLEGLHVGAMADSGRRRSDADALRSDRWPTRPGETQHAWEPPRVLRRAESGVGVVPDGLSPGLVRHRRRALEALGNAVVPQVAHVVARRALAILEDTCAS